MCLNFYGRNLVYAWLILSLFACKKKQNYTIRIIADDANTARVWGLVPQEKAFAEQRVAKVRGNPNDATITNIKISYFNKFGHQIEEDFDDYSAKKNRPIFIRNYKLVPGTRITVTALAKETGEIVPHAPDKKTLLTKSAKVEKAKVMLKIEILKDGVIFGGNYKTGEQGQNVEVTMLSTVTNEW